MEPISAEFCVAITGDVKKKFRPLNVFFCNFRVGRSSKRRPMMPRFLNSEPHYETQDKRRTVPIQGHGNG